MRWLSGEVYSLTGELTPWAGSVVASEGGLVGDRGRSVAKFTGLFVLSRACGLTDLFVCSHCIELFGSSSLSCLRSFFLAGIGVSLDFEQLFSIKGEVSIH